MKESNIVPLYKKYALTINESVHYYGIGETKLRELIRKNPCAPFLMYNGIKVLIKRVKFEEFLDDLTYV